MILPRGFPGIAFGEASDGDARSDTVARRVVSSSLGIPEAWATVDQVHGSTVVTATAPGNLGSADGIITRARLLPIAVATADCVPFVIVGRDSVAIVHAGWRGVAAGVARRARRAMGEAGDEVIGAVIGPHIGPCCYEVGTEVVEAVGGYGKASRSGTLSVDLGAAIRDQLPRIEIHEESLCTMHDDRFHSYRENATRQRQVTVAWIPRD